MLMSRVGKSFDTGKGKNDVLRNISLNIHEGEFVCIMGSTGCGKSTLMRIMSGIEKCSSGTFNLYEHDVTKGIPKKYLNHLGTMFQSDNLLEWRTVYDNVKLPLEVFGIRNFPDSKQRITSALELVGLLDYKDCYPKELSGGMRQRCAVARALVHSPDILLMDQPFGALDAITRKTLNQELLKIYHKTGCTGVMVTNNVSEALTIATRVIVLGQSPTTITAKIDVPFTYEERINDLIENPEFLKLRAELDRYVRASDGRSGH